MFERNAVEVREQRPARKQPLDEKEVRALLGKVGEVVIARGQKTDVYPAKNVTPDMLKGPSGSFRAPMLVRGKTMLVGFSAQTLESWFG